MRDRVTITAVIGAILAAIGVGILVVISEYKPTGYINGGREALLFGGAVGAFMLAGIATAVALGVRGDRDAGDGLSVWRVWGFRLAAMVTVLLVVGSFGLGTAYIRGSDFFLKDAPAARSLQRHPGVSQDFCQTHSCIDNFSNGRGSIVQCADGSYSQSGGIQGACSHHGGGR